MLNKISRGLAISGFCTWTAAAAAVALIDVGRANAGQLEDATAAYKKRDYATALSLWRPLAEQGNAAAETGLGILYENGFAVPKDETQAVDWYRKAAEQGDSEAEYRLGERYVAGTSGLPHDIARGLAMMKKAGEQGNARSFSQLGDFYRLGLYGVANDAAQAFTWYRKAADLGYAIAESRVAIAYQFGLGVPKDLAQADLWYRKAEQQARKDAERGDVAAQLNLGMMYEFGEGTIAANKSAALYWYQKAAQQDGPLKQMAEMDLVRIQNEIKDDSDKGDR
jgi:uncharacterized protein